jgi:hypothetical protein
MKQINKFQSAALVAFLIASNAMTAQTQAVVLPNPTRPDIGNAANFALLSATVITTGGLDLTNSSYKKIGTKNTALAGGVWTANFTTSGIEYEGAGPTGYTGLDIHYGELASAAYSDASAAYTSTKDLVIAGLTSSTIGTEVINGGILTGLTFTHGMYTGGTGATADATALFVGGDFTLDGGGNPNSVFIFYTGAAFSTSAGTASSVKMLLTNGASANNVFWLTTGSFDTGADVTMGGTVIALNGAAGTGANNEFAGQLITLTGAISTGSALKMNAIPEPSTYGLAMVAVGIGAMMRRRRACASA